MSQHPEFPVDATAQTSNGSPLLEPPFLYDKPSFPSSPPLPSLCLQDYLSEANDALADAAETDVAFAATLAVISDPFPCNLTPEGDPRVPTAECACVSGNHTGKVIYRENEDPTSTAAGNWPYQLDMHVPFRLLNPMVKNEPLFYDPVQPGAFTPIGFRFLYHAYGVLQYCETFGVTHTSVRIAVAPAIGRATVQDLMTTALRNAGCPKLTFPDPEDGFMKFRQTAGFQSTQ